MQAHGEKDVRSQEARPGDTRRSKMQVQEQERCAGTVARCMCLMQA